MGYPINDLDSFPTPRTDHDTVDWTVLSGSLLFGSHISYLDWDCRSDGSEAPVTGSVNSITELLLARVWSIKRLGLKRSRAERHVLPSSEAKIAVAIRLWIEATIDLNTTRPLHVGHVYLTF
ncbi:hypothetical protein TorRG33x02_186120 [Trema orientale]|uniref:Uncharacterized protein n=1 Tax=Trema orientale TaxID=63057 RepID=A0A2P5EJ82_TREOI|nr:hypothetical protein TorRG33x02_186120 [Trema orientale]